NHIALNPSSLQGYVAIARSLLAQGRAADALGEIERATEILGPLPILVAFAAQGYARLGQTDRALARLNQLREMAVRRDVPGMYAVRVHVALDNRAETFRGLQLAADQRSGWLVLLRAEPGWDPLRADPRFVSLLERLHLDF